MILDRVFTACRAVAGVKWFGLDDEQGKGKRKASTPLHLMCQTLAAMKDDLKTGTVKRTVYIDNIPPSMASETALRAKLDTRSYIRDLETDVEWVRIRTRPNGTSAHSFPNPTDAACCSPISCSFGVGWVRAPD